jgi:hypothetical protein
MIDLLNVGVKELVDTLNLLGQMGLAFEQVGLNDRHQGVFSVELDFGDRDGAQCG